MADHTAFFYGTLMAPGVLYRVCYGTATPQSHQTAHLRIRPALLRGYRRHRVRHADYPGVVAEAAGAGDCSVLGTYVTGLTPMDLARLDTFEGDDYQRTPVRVHLLAGSVDDALAATAHPQVLAEVDTEVYVFLDRAELEEAEWDFAAFKRDKLSAWTLQSRSDYEGLSYDDGSGAVDGTGGRGATGAITAQLQAEYAGKEADPEKGAEVARAAV